MTYLSECGHHVADTFVREWAMNPLPAEPDGLLIARAHKLRRDLAREKQENRDISTFLVWAAGERYWASFRYRVRGVSNDAFDALWRMRDGLKRWKVAALMDERVRRLSGGAGGGAC